MTTPGGFATEYGIHRGTVSRWAKQALTARETWIQQNPATGRIRFDRAAMVDFVRQRGGHNSAARRVRAVERERGAQAGD